MVKASRNLAIVKLKLRNPRYPKNLHSFEIPFEKSRQDYYILGLL